MHTRRTKYRESTTAAAAIDSEEEEWKGIVFKNSRKKAKTREEVIMAKVAEAQAYLARSSGGGSSGSLNGLGGKGCYGSANSFRDK